LSWFAGMSIVFFWSTRAMAAGRLRDLVAVGALLIAGLFCLSLTSENVPWAKLYKRFVGQESRSVVSLGSRTQIWQSGINYWCSDVSVWVRGAGTGMADEAVGHYGQAAATTDQYGNSRRNCHSVYIEWLVSYGIIGLVVGGCLLAGMFHAAWRLDRPDGMANRLAVLATVLVFAATVDLFRRPDWVATGSLVLAMLSHVSAINVVFRSANDASSLERTATRANLSHPPTLRTNRFERKSA
jgi:O-antigen ligase